jgi:hypothetical protein
MSDSDILRGCPQIRAFINTLLETPLSERQVYAALELRQLPSKKFLGQYVCLKAAIRAALGADSSTTPTKTVKRSVI